MNKNPEMIKFSAYYLLIVKQFDSAQGTKKPGKSPAFNVILFIQTVITD